MQMQMQTRMEADAAETDEMLGISHEKDEGKSTNRIIQKDTPGHVV